MSEFTTGEEFKAVAKRCWTAHKLKSWQAFVLKNLKIQRNKKAVDEPPTDLSLNNDDSKDDCKDDAFEVTDNGNNALDSPSPSPHDQRLDVSLTPDDSMTPDSLPRRDVGAELAKADTSSEEEKKEESPDDQDLEQNTRGSNWRPYRHGAHAATDGSTQHFDEAYFGDDLIDLKNERRRVAVYEPPTDLSLNNDDSMDDFKDDEVTDNSPSPSPTARGLHLTVAPRWSQTPESFLMMDVDAEMAKADISSEEEKKEESPDDQSLHAQRYVESSGLHSANFDELGYLRI